jgi:hypothetical protein
VKCIVNQCCFLSGQFDFTEVWLTWSYIVLFKCSLYFFEQCIYSIVLYSASLGWARKQAFHSKELIWEGKTKSEGVQMYSDLVFSMKPFLMRQVQNIQGTSLHVLSVPGRSTRVGVPQSSSQWLGEEGRHWSCRDISFPENLPIFLRAEIATNYRASTFNPKVQFWSICFILFNQISWLRTHSHLQQWPGEYLQGRVVNEPIVSLGWLGDRDGMRARIGI